jgi:hypothetical protein
MVSQEIVQAEQQLAEEEAKFAVAKTKIQQLNPRVKQTRRQLQRATPKSQMDVRAAERKRELEKKEQLVELEKQRQRFIASAAPTRFAIEDARAYDSAMKAYSKGMLWAVVGFNAGSPREIYWGKKILKQHSLAKQHIFTLPGGWEGYQEAKESGATPQSALYQAGRAVQSFKPTEVSMADYNVLLEQTALKGDAGKKALYDIQYVTPIPSSPLSSPPQNNGQAGTVSAVSAVSAVSEFTPEQKKDKEFLEIAYGKNKKNNIFTRGWGAIGVGFTNLVSKFVPKKKPPVQNWFGKPVVDEAATMSGGTTVYKMPSEADLFKQGGVGLVVGSKIQKDVITAGVSNQYLLDAKAAQVEAAISPGGITEKEAAGANLFLSNYATQLREESSKKIKSDIKLYEAAAISTYKPITSKIRGLTSSWKPSTFDAGVEGRKVFDALDSSSFVTKFEKRVAVKTVMYGGSFASGAYEGIRTKPEKAVLTGGIVAGITLATGGIGAGLGAAGISTTTGAVATTGKVVGAGILGYYALSTAGRIATTPGGTSAKFFKAGGIASTEVVPMVIAGYATAKAVSAGKDWYRTRGMKEIKLAKYDTKPFYSKREGKWVYMERFGGMKWNKPSSWWKGVRGYKKGQFTGRTYKQIPFEVMGKMQGKKTVSFWEINRKTKKVKMVTRGTESFPYDVKTKQLDWFKKGNVAEYGMPSPSKLPKNLRNKPLGYSASPERWADLKIRAETGAYYSGKGWSGYFFGVAGKKYSLYGGNIFTPFGTTPTGSAVYGKAAKIKGARGEIKIKDMGKTYDWYNPKTIKEGVFNLPLKKPEVEALLYGVRVPVREAYYMSFMGRRIPISEEIITSYAPGTVIAGAAGTPGTTAVVGSSSYAPIVSSSIITPGGLLATSIVGRRSSPTYSVVGSSYPSSSPISSSTFEYKGGSDFVSSAPSSPISSISSSTPSSSPLSSYTPSSTPSTPTSYTPSPPPSSYTTALTSSGINRGRRANLFGIGYKVEVKRQGIFKELKGIYAKSEAIKLGEKRATSTLAATFRIKQTSVRVRKVDKSQYTPSPVEFRSYKIAKGKKVELKDTWIQKRGKRLGRKSEVREIKISKKSKGRKIKIL